MPVGGSSNGFSARSAEPLCGSEGTFWLVLVTGGPRVIARGWVIVGFFLMLAGMANFVILVSIYPKGGVSTALFALTGICVIGLYPSYAIPIYLRLRNPDFQVGPWHLKGRHRLVGWTALGWIAAITAPFVGSRPQGTEEEPAALEEQQGDGA